MTLKNQLRNEEVGLRNKNLLRLSRNEEEDRPKAVFLSMEKRTSMRLDQQRKLLESEQKLPYSPRMKHSMIRLTSAVCVSLA